MLQRERIISKHTSCVMGVLSLWSTTCVMGVLSLLLPLESGSLNYTYYSCVGGD